MRSEYGQVVSQKQETKKKNLHQNLPRNMVDFSIDLRHTSMDGRDKVLHTELGKKKQVSGLD